MSILGLGRVDSVVLDACELFLTRNRAKWESNCRRPAFSPPFCGDSILYPSFALYKTVANPAVECLAPRLIGDGFWETCTKRFVANAIERNS
jgi:hypothetical protein